MKTLMLLVSLLNYAGNAPVDGSNLRDYNFSVGAYYTSVAPLGLVPTIASMGLTQAATDSSTLACAISGVIASTYYYLDSKYIGDLSNLMAYSEMSGLIKEAYRYEVDRIDSEFPYLLALQKEITEAGVELPQGNSLLTLGNLIRQADERNLFSMDPVRASVLLSWDGVREAMLNGKLVAALDNQEERSTGLYDDSDLSHNLELLPLRGPGIHRSNEVIYRSAKKWAKSWLAWLSRPFAGPVGLHQD